MRSRRSTNRVVRKNYLDNEGEEWTQEEDEIITRLVTSNLENPWKEIQDEIENLYGIQKPTKQLRERWQNYLDPNIKKGQWDPREQFELFCHVSTIGKRWSQIARHIVGRNEHSVKNEYHRLMRTMFPEAQVPVDQKETMILNHFCNIVEPVAKRSVQQEQKSKSNSIVKQLWNPSFEKIDGSSVSSNSIASQDSMNMFSGSYTFDPPAWQGPSCQFSFLPDVGMQVEDMPFFGQTVDPFAQRQAMLACLSTDSQIAQYEASNMNCGGDQVFMDIEDPNA